MMQHKKGIVFLLTLTAILTLSLIGCERTQNDVTESSVSETTNLIEEEQTVNNDDVNRVSENETTQTDGEIVAPTKEEVLAMRALVLEGMSEKEIERLTENIKIANNKMEIDSMQIIYIKHCMIWITFYLDMELKMLANTREMILLFQSIMGY